jgi:sortase (surface protein transpeptidase)
LLVLAVLTACGTTVNESVHPVTAESTPTRSGAPAKETRVPRAVRNFRSTRRYAVVARPESIRIPGIGVNSRLQELGRNADGTIEVPEEWDVAGWFKGSARPGQPGPAVIVGHVDSRMGPAVFYKLRALVPGDKILVDQRDGRTAKFVVHRVERHEKSRFPTADVYFPTLRPVLRLVTCGGTFDQSIGHYRDNVIVFASLAH